MARKYLWDGALIGAILVLGLYVGYVDASRRADRRHDLQAQITQNRALTKRVNELSLANCTTINDNTQQVYGVALAFKAIVQILEHQIPGSHLHATVEEPKYLNCRRRTQ